MHKVVKWLWQKESGSSLVILCFVFFCFVFCFVFLFVLFALQVSVSSLLLLLRLFVILMYNRQISIFHFFFLSVVLLHSCLLGTIVGGALDVNPCTQVSKVG